MQFGILGPMLVRAGDTTIEMASSRQRILLAALMLRAGQPVSLDSLADATWDAPPEAAASTLRTYVMRLRRTLGPGEQRVVARHPGYLLDASTDEVDALLFARLCRDGGAAIHGGAFERASDTLGKALALWRGGPLSDVPSQVLRREEVPRLEQLHVQARQWRVEADLALGRHQAVVAELSDLVAANPTREPIAGLLMLALYRSGRQAEALDAYRSTRARLVDDLGVEPGPDLQRLHQRMLAADPSLDGAPERPAVTVSPANHAIDEDKIPRHLPVAVPYFAGRRAEITRLTGLIDRSTASAGAVVIAAIGGMAGVGKTTLAVYWAHQVADRFPDGQLYADMRGVAHPSAPLPAEEAVHGFLIALGVPTDRIPSDPHDQAGLYRSRLAGKKMLIFLDNVHDEDQVRPLLPANANCLVIVTSRRQLPGLVTAEGAHPVALDLLPPADARDLLAKRLGPERVARQASAVEDITARCAGLPLALALVAARAAMHPRFPLSTLAAELRDAISLEPFRSDDDATDLHAVFTSSYRILSPDAARLFRLMSTHPGPDLGAVAAASLIGATPAATRALLAELTRAHLLTEHLPGRYAYHDLLRSYAADLAASLDRPDQRKAAVLRGVDHYAHTAYTAAILLKPDIDRVDIPPAQPGVTSDTLTDAAGALAWFAAERPVLLTIVSQAAAAGFDAHVGYLAWALTSFLQWQGHWQDWAAVQNAALDAARRLDDPARQATAHRLLGAAYTRLGRDDDAHLHLRHALDLYDRLHYRDSAARTHLSLALALEQQGRHGEALGHAESALRLYEATGLPSGQARALNAIGWLRALLGDQPGAVLSCERALVLFRDTGDRVGQAAAWDSLGYAHHLHHDPHAIACYRHAVDLLREVGDRYLVATTLTRLGDAYDVAGDDPAAEAVWQESWAILAELGHPDAAGVAARLEAPRPSVTSG